MSNMSYCRFENTARDLDDCQNALEEMMTGEGQPLSRSELEAAKRLARTCVAILDLLAEANVCSVEELLDDELTDEAVDAIQVGAEE